MVIKLEKIALMCTSLYKYDIFIPQIKEIYEDGYISHNVSDTTKCLLAYI